MKVLFLGSFIPDEYASRVQQLSAAGNQYQYNLYCTLAKAHEVHALCYLPIDMNDEKEEIIDVSRKEEIELFLPKNSGIFCELISFRKRLKKWSNWADCIITYNIQYPWFNIGDGAKKVLILADYTPVEEETWKKKWYSYCIKRSFSQYDKVVLLSEKSKKYVKEKQDSIVIHGCVNWKNFESMKYPICGENVFFMYSGVLNRVTGVDMLLEAFENTSNPRYRLILCGQGEELKEQINEVVRKDRRVNFYGYVTKEKYLELLEKSNVLVNPRNMQMKQNEFNFPSKVLEYLAAGRYIVSTKFKGYNEFEQYIDFVESDIDSISDGLERAAEEINDKSTEIYKKNREYAKKLTWDNLTELFL